MKILFLAHRIPFPPNKGDKIRSFNELKYLANLGDVYLGALVDNPEDFKYQKNLEAYCKEIHLAPISPALKKITSLRGLVCGPSLSVLYFHNKKLQQAINNLLIKHDFDAIFCFSSTMAEYVLKASCHWSTTDQKRPRLIMDFCDVDSIKWTQYSAEAKWPLSAFYQREWKLLSAYERKIAQLFDHSIFVSSREKQLFEKLNPGCGQIVEIPNGVDMEYFKPQSSNNTPAANSPEIIFTGAMDYHANIDGVSWFHEKIWPKILKVIPNARFTIVGSNPSPVIKKMDNGTNIHVTGFVTDIRSYYSNADVCVVPLRIARGIQNKVLEAMSMAKAVVCTTNAFTGIKGDPGEVVLVKDNENSFAHAVIDIVKNMDLRNKLGKNGRQCIEKYYHWDQNLSILEKLIEKK